MNRLTLPLLIIVSALWFSGCATVPPQDYTSLRASHPRSILVLPPANETTEINATYGMMAASTQPLSELGYYVFPVAVVDLYMKENGLSVADEMHAVPLDKLRKVFGADSVLYITVESYGSKYQVIASNTYVHARARLVGSLDGTELWNSRVEVVFSGSNGLIEALVEQVINKLVDKTKGVADMAAVQLYTMPDQGLLKGPYHPQFGTD